MKIVYIATLLLAMGGCASKSNEATQQETTEKRNAETNPELLEMPEVPTNLVTPEDRARFMVEHFWDKMDFADTTRTHNLAFMQQNFVNYLAFMGYVGDAEAISRSFSALMDRAEAEPKGYSILMETADSYLDDPNSPMRSEELYIIYLETLLKKGKLPEGERAKKEYRLEQAMKNRVGTKATDFAYRKKDGVQTTLYRSLPERGNLMLIFFDPECEHCDEILGELIKDKELARLVEAGEMKVLAIYTGAKEAEWKRKIAEFPPAWETGIDGGAIDEQELYYLPAMPTVYILDSSGTVTGKDISI